ncbi:MAG: ATP-binding protein [Desulfobacterota bacterium]|nr:ATP-binding protein [Thermodesulfobacteriota bacterium]MDW8001658.1 ATP-binding protein [Deltaproteobacteria bacterium]
MSIYTIPPLISSIVLFIFFVIGIFRGKTERQNILFSFVCLLGFFLNLDKMLLTLVEDETQALKISRLDHMFLVFIIPLYMHFSCALTGKGEYSKVYKVLYAISFLLMPFTQTDYYLSGVRRHFFGFFATAGPLFYAFGLLSIVSIGLSMFILFSSLREETVALKRAKVKYIILSMGSSAFLSHFDLLVVLGWDVYPFGNFIFLPMSLLAYSLLKHDIMEWKIFLNRGLLFFIFFFLSSALFLGLITIVDHLYGRDINPYLNSLFAFFVSLAFVLAFRDRIESIVLNMTLKEELKRRGILKELSLSILKIGSIQDVKEFVIGRLRSAFQLRECAIRPRLLKEPQRNVRFFSETDPEWRKGYRVGLVVPSDRAPQELLLGEKLDMTLYTEEEIELLSILANNLALAIDNAYIYGQLKDFSESLEKMVEEKTKALIRSESLAEIGRLAAGVAHELNNPLASVRSTIEYHIDRLDKEGDLYGDLEFCLKELNRAENIVKSLLYATRQKEEEKSQVNVHGAIEDSLRILYNEYKKRPIEIKKELRAENPLIFGVHGRVCQVLINLIKNGIEAIGEKNGYLKIATDNTEDGSLRIVIEDNGCGMDEETKKNLFKPFFTTKHQGVGLGLYVSYEIVKSLKGEIFVESEKGKGSRFILVFPPYQL